MVGARRPPSRYHPSPSAAASPASAWLGAMWFWGLGPRRKATVDAHPLDGDDPTQGEVSPTVTRQTFFNLAVLVLLAVLALTTASIARSLRRIERMERHSRLVGHGSDDRAHAAALAAEGAQTLSRSAPLPIRFLVVPNDWRLLAPPLMGPDDEHERTALMAPLAYWLQYGEFDSAGECQKRENALGRRQLKNDDKADSTESFRTQHLQCVPLEHLVFEAERAKGPPFNDLLQMSSRDANGNAVRVVSTSVHIENGAPVWYVGTLGKCGGELAPPDLQAQVRAEFAKYTTTPVKFEAGSFATTSGNGGNPFKNCK